MPDFRCLPLGQLVYYCPPFLQATSAEARSAWAELLRRALVEQNQAAWDALMMRLWPGILYWIYTRAPEIAPATAEQLAQRILTEFKRRQPPTTHHAAPVSHERLLADLQGLVERLLAQSFS